jgi:2-hydroxy-3-keto-5-methylthiopentenyl-1-phosphate phosphatase
MDFDGTTVEPNVAIELVSEFVPDGARVAHQIDLDLHSGRISLREAWAREVELLPSDRYDEMAEYCRRTIPLRKGARELVELLTAHRVPVAIVSGGLDFYIRPVLEREGLDVPLFSDTVERESPGAPFRLVHPHGHPTCRLCGICKAQVVRDHAAPNTPVVFIGDGSTDRYAAEVADVVFARHRLLTYCRQQGIPHLEFEDLHPVVERVDRWLRGAEGLPVRPRTGLTGSNCPISAELARAPPA